MESIMGFFFFFHLLLLFFPPPFPLTTPSHPGHGICVHRPHAGGRRGWEGLWVHGPGAQAPGRRHRGAGDLQRPGGVQGRDLRLPDASQHGHPEGRPGEPHRTARVLTLVWPLSDWPVFLVAGGVVHTATRRADGAGGTFRQWEELLRQPAWELLQTTAGSGAAGRPASAHAATRLPTLQGHVLSRPTFQTCSRHEETIRPCSHRSCRIFLTLKMK